MRLERPPRRERSLPRPGPLCPAPPRQGFRLQWAASLPRFLPARSCRFKSAVPPARKSGAGAPGTRAIRPASLRGQQGRVIYDVRSSSPPWGSKNNEMDLSLKNEMVVHDISHRIFEKSGGASLSRTKKSLLHNISSGVVPIRMCPIPSIDHLTQNRDFVFSSQSESTKLALQNREMTYEIHFRFHPRHKLKSNP